MCVIVSLVCLFAVYEISYGVTTGDLTPEQVFLKINRQHEQFPETVIKPLLQELENRPKLTSELRSKELSMKAAHRTDSEIDIQPVGNSSGSIKVKHAANSEFHVTPHRSDTASTPVQNTIKLGGRKVLLVSNPDVQALEGTRQNKIYVSNLDSRLLRMNGIPTNLNAVNGYPLTTLEFLSDSQPSSDMTVLQPRTVLVAHTVRQPRTRLVSNLPSVNLVTRSQKVLSPRFFPRTSLGFNSFAIQPANRIEIFHRPPFSTILPVSINPNMVQPTPLPFLPVGHMLPVPCNCLPQPMCCLITRVL